MAKLDVINPIYNKDDLPYKQCYGVNFLEQGIT